MRSMAIAFIALALCASLASAVPFSPQVLRLNVPGNLQYDFDGKDLTIPVTVSGGSPLGLFFVFTKDKAESISKVQNGFLGWHYVNKIDTCIYASVGIQLTPGSNTILWSGRDDDDNVVPAGDYTYYLWAHDNTGNRILASKFFKFAANSRHVIQERGSDGQPLAEPLLLDVLKRWTLGTDPEDTTFVETTKVTYPTGWGGIGYGPSAIDPVSANQFYISIWNKDSNIQGIGKYQWVPNGDATLVTNWGNDGFSTYSAGYDAEPGVVTDGAYLYSGDSNHHAAEAQASMYVFDFDGSIIKSIDLTDWWSDPEDKNAGAQMNGGPTIYHEKNGFIYLNCHCSCIKQMVNPMADDEDFVVWTNQNGDHVLDHNDETSALRPWACNDYNVGPYTYNIYADANMFSICPTFDMGAVSFGLIAPDGTGVGYFAWAGETASQKFGNLICQNGSAFDGIYTSKNSADARDTILDGIWFIGHDSVKGTISTQIAVRDEIPAAFTVAQNVPNPFNPTTTISFTLAKSGKTTVEVFNTAGQKLDTLVNGSLRAGSHSVNWNASRFSAGVYFYTIRSGSFSKTMKMTLLK